jgi:hypothetical protein
MAANFSSPDEDVINRKVNVFHDSHIDVPDSNQETVYEIMECIEWIQKNNFKRVSLLMHAMCIHFFMSTILNLKYLSFVAVENI